MISSKKFLSSEHDEQYPKKGKIKRRKKEPLQISLASDLESEQMSDNGSARQS